MKTEQKARNYILNSTCTIIIAIPIKKHSQNVVCHKLLQQSIDIYKKMTIYLNSSSNIAGIAHNCFIPKKLQKLQNIPSSYVGDWTTPYQKLT